MQRLPGHWAQARLTSSRQQRSHHRHCPLESPSTPPAAYQSLALQRTMLYISAQSSLHSLTPSLCIATRDPSLSYLPSLPASSASSSIPLTPRTSQPRLSWLCHRQATRGCWSTSNRQQAKARCLHLHCPACGSTCTLICITNPANTLSKIGCDCLAVHMNVLELINFGMLTGRYRLRQMQIGMDTIPRFDRLKP